MTAVVSIPQPTGEAIVGNGPLIPDRVSPARFLDQAIKAVPAVKYALGVGGIVAVVAIVASFKTGFKVAVLGTIVMFVLMTLLVIFSRLVSANASIFRAPMLVLTWFSLILMMTTSLALFSSVFFNWPLGFRDFKINSSSIELGTRGTSSPTVASTPDAANSQRVTRAAETPATETPPVDPAEAEAKKRETAGDTAAFEAMLSVVGIRSDGSTMQDNELQLGPRLWEEAQFDWKQSLALTKDPIATVRLRTKLSDESSLICDKERDSDANCRVEPASMGDTLWIGHRGWEVSRRKLEGLE